MEEIKHILGKFDIITFKEMGQVKLMNRIDTKYILHINRLSNILEKASKDYYIFKISGNLNRTYTTSYYDTTGYKMYHDHHNRKLNRFKIRERTYTDTKEEFLEVKFKNNKRFTIKRRIKIGTETDKLDKNNFVKEKSPYFLEDLNLSLTNRFARIMLVSKLMNERVTIDTNLEYLTKTGYERIPNLVIIEQKRSAYNKRTKFTSILLEERIKSVAFSKYCIGMVLTRSKTIKSNRFKPKIRLLNKLNIV